MRRKNIRTILLSVVIVVCSLSCQNKNFYYIQHTKIDRFDYQIFCNPELVDKVNTSWLKHGKFDCYYYNQFTQDFPKNYKECVIGLSTIQIKELLGSPNHDRGFKLEYIISLNCSDRMKLYSKLIFYYDSRGKIKDVKFGSFTITDGIVQLSVSGVK